MKQLISLILAAAATWIPLTGCAQQRPDKDFDPGLKQPLFPKGQGPVMLIDAGHHNFHTLEERFAPFGKVAVASGFQVKSISRKFEKDQLKDAKILVIANALHEENIEAWEQPVHPAFSDEEVAVIKDWVSDGGRLFLIADHMPFPGAASNLAAAFGYEFYDGFAMRRPRKNYDLFSRNNQMLQSNSLTEGIDSIVSFTGQAFQIPDDATAVLTLDSNYWVLMPEVAWQFNDQMKMQPAAGLSQLAYSRFGKGKVVVSGEAAMFTAQVAGKVKVGMNADFAPNNLPLLLNILEWLTSEQ